MKFEGTVLMVIPSGKPYKSKEARSSTKVLKRIFYRLFRSSKLGSTAITDQGIT
jgi:hypothetical protein